MIDNAPRLMQVVMRSLHAKSKTYESMESLLRDDEDNVVKLLLDWEVADSLETPEITETDISNVKHDLEVYF